MNCSRKAFLKTIALGGLAAFTRPVTSLASWSERGMRLVRVQRETLAMGSLVSFDVVAGSREDGYEAIRRAVSEFRRLEGKLSMYKPDSEASRLGAQAGRNPLPLSEETMEVLHYARQVFRKSGRKFDITVEPVMRQWGFRRDPATDIPKPTDRQLQQLEQLVGSDKMILEEGKAKLESPGMAIDLGGIAGGYALDKAMAAIRKTGVAAAFINFSGDIHTFGRPMHEEKWSVHLVDPQTREPLAETIELEDEALSTSGSYQNRRHDGSGHSWGHLLLPGRARPIEPIGSVTAIHSSAMTADAWSTATYVGAEAPKEVRIIRLGQGTGSRE